MIVRAFCVAMCCLLLTLWAAGSVIPGLAKDETLLLDCFERYAHSAHFGVAAEEYPLFASQLAAFFRHKTENPNVSGHPFLDYEVVHLFDVRNLLDGLQIFAYGCLLGAAVLIVCLARLFKRQRFSFLPGFGAYLVLVGCVIAAAVCSFGTVFYYLHELLFTNDLWLLNPTTDLLIALMPEGMFMHLAVRVLCAVLPLPVLLGAAAVFSQKYAQPRR